MWLLPPLSLWMCICCELYGCLTVMAKFHIGWVLVLWWQKCTYKNQCSYAHVNKFFIKSLNKSDLWECDKQKEVRNRENGGNRKRVERWECCSLGCRLGGGAWKRPCHGLPLVESAQYPSNHPAPSLSSLPSVNRAGEQEMVWQLPWKLTGSRRIGGKVCYPKKAENWGSQWSKSRQRENLVSLCLKGDFVFFYCLLF